MTLPLDIGDNLIDRQKSSMMLYYMARATYRQQHREISKKKVELALKQLKKLGTKELHKHIEELELHIAEAIEREKDIQGRQKDEEGTHRDLKGKITKLERQLTKYLHTQESRKKRIEDLDLKIKRKFQTKREKIVDLKSDYAKLKKFYTAAKKAKENKRKLRKLKGRMQQLKTKIDSVK